MAENETSPDVVEDPNQDVRDAIDERRAYLEALRTRSNEEKVKTEAEIDRERLQAESKRLEQEIDYEIQAAIQLERAKAQREGKSAEEVAAIGAEYQAQKVAEAEAAAAERLEAEAAAAPPAPPVEEPTENEVDLTPPDFSSIPTPPTFLPEASSDTVDIDADKDGE
jgi:predicted phage gp36 major capsid-like protein